MPDLTPGSLIAVEDVTGSTDPVVIESGEQDLLESIAELGVDVRVWR